MEPVELARSLSSQIVDLLRSEVLTGRLKEGQVLRQRELIRRFGVSGTPVREAFIQLTHEGFLEAAPNAGVRVKKPAPDHVQRFLTPLRRAIEVYALELCFDDLDDSDFLAWNSTLTKLRDACERRDYPAIAEHEMAFHRSILKRAADPTLLGIWSMILAQVVAAFRASYIKYEDPVDIYREHAEIVATFRTGDKGASIKLYSEMIGGPIPLPPDRN